MCLVPDDKSTEMFSNYILIYLFFISSISKTDCKLNEDKRFSSNGIENFSLSVIGN